MKISDINQDLMEAEGDFADRVKKKAGEYKDRVKTKATKYNPVHKKARQDATRKENVDNIKRQGIKLRDDFLNWMSETSSEGDVPTGDDVVLYITDNVPELAPFVKDVGKAFKFTGGAPEKAEVKPSSNSDGDSEQGDTSDDKDAKGDKPKRVISPDEQAGYDKINKDAEEEAAEFEKQDLKASKGDDEEPKVDTSASIYESRLAAMLFERELQGNDIDTFMVRLLQAKKKGKPTTAEVGSIPEPEDAQGEEEPQQASSDKGQAQAGAPQAAAPKANSGNGSTLDYFEQDLLKLIQKENPEVATKLQKSIKKLVNQLR